jgi:hypothetical protein
MTCDCGQCCDRCGQHTDDCATRQAPPAGDQARNDHYTL